MRNRLNNDLIERAELAYRRGLRTRDAAAQMGITVGTLKRWLKEGSAALEEAADDAPLSAKALLYLKVERAIAEHQRDCLQNIEDIASRADNPDWCASAWLLERVHRSEYGPSVKAEHDVKAEQQVTVVFAADVPEEALEAMLDEG